MTTKRDRAPIKPPFDDSYKELIENGGVLDKAKKLVDGLPE